MAEAQSRNHKLKDLERKVDALSQEIERLKVDGEAPSRSGAETSPWSRLSLGGYGEITLQRFARRRQNADTAALRNEITARRVVVYLGYGFTDAIHFKSELEFEDGGSGEGSETRGEVALEQAYVDFRLYDPLTVRAGLVLVPVGLINETHEPPTFHGVNRPSVERLILPSTWRENAVGLAGRYGPVAYRSYLMAGMTAVANTDPAVDGFKGSTGIRGGRNDGSKSFAEDMAWVSRLDWTPVEGATTGGSFYVGEADQNLTAASVPVTLWELHGRAEWRGAELRALYAQSTVGNADSVNAAQTTAAGTAGFTDFVGRRQFGGYVEGAFNVLSLAPQTTKTLAPFFRYERLDTQSQVPNGFVDPATGSGNARGANSRVEYTAGLTFKPIPNLAVKTDYQWKRNQARTGVNQWNLGLGFEF